MHLDSVLQFQKLEPKKHYRYTYLKFARGQHNDLIDTSAAVYQIGGSFLIVPIKGTVYTSESEKEALRTVKSEIEMHIGVQTESPDTIVNDYRISKENRRNDNQKDAKGRIRTGEPLQERILSPSPLAGLGYLRADTLFLRPVGYSFGSSRRRASPQWASFVAKNSLRKIREDE